MPLSYHQIEWNKHFISAVEVCNLIYTSFNIFKEKIKAHNRHNQHKKISLSKDAAFLDENILGLLALLDRLLVVHQIYEKNRDLRWLDRQVRTISSALEYSIEKVNLIIESTGNEIQTSLKQQELPTLSQALSNLTHLLNKTYTHESALLLNNIFTPLASALTGQFLTPMLTEKQAAIELDMLDTKQNKNNSFKM